MFLLYQVTNLKGSVKLRAPKRPVSSQHKAMKMMTLCNLEKVSEGGRDILSLGKNLMSGNLVMA